MMSKKSGRKKSSAEKIGDNIEDDKEKIQEHVQDLRELLKGKCT